MASVSKRTTKKGETRYAVRHRDPRAKAREKWFVRKADADRFAGTVR